MCTVQYISMCTVQYISVCTIQYISVCTVLYIYISVSTVQYITVCTVQYILRCTQYNIHIASFMLKYEFRTNCLHVSQRKLFLINKTFHENVVFFSNKTPMIHFYGSCVLNVMLIFMHIKYY